MEVLPFGHATHPHLHRAYHISVHAAGVTRLCALCTQEPGGFRPDRGSGG